MGDEKVQPANLSVVLTNLPEEVTLGQVERFCKKAGALATHPETGEPLIILNTRACKATVTFSYPEGANHAISLLSDEEFVKGHPVKVARAPKEPFNFSLWKPAFHQQRKFHAYVGEHEEDLGRAEEKRLKIMILRKVFTPKELIENPELYGQLVKDWTSTCAQFGKVTLVKPMENNIDGVVIVRFETAQAASLAIGELDNATYRERQIVAEPWDGRDLSGKESAEDEAARIRKYEGDLEKTDK
jgi:hypothetical protein